MSLKIFGAAFDAMNKIATNFHFKPVYAVVVKRALQAKNSLKSQISFLDFFSKIEYVELMEVHI